MLKLQEFILFYLFYGLGFCFLKAFPGKRNEPEPPLASQLRGARCCRPPAPQLVSLNEAGAPGPAPAPCSAARPRSPTQGPGEGTDTAVWGAPQGGGGKAACKRLFPAPSSCPRCFWGRIRPRALGSAWGWGWAECCCDRPSPRSASGLTSIHLFHNLSWDADSAVSKCTGQQL